MRKNNNDVSPTPLDNKVINIQSASESSAVTLESVLFELDNWRTNKSNPREGIPDDLLIKMFSLKEQHPEPRLRAVFGMSVKQYEQHYHRLYGNTSDNTSHKNTAPVVDFCEVKPDYAANKENKVNKKANNANKDEEAYKKYGPSLLPATNTVVVEYKRPDGYLLRIHMTDDSFPKLLKEFATMEFE